MGSGPGIYIYIYIWCVFFDFVTRKFGEDGTQFDEQFFEKGVVQPPTIVDFC